MTRNKILWLSDSPLTCTGYGRVSTEICNNLKDWEVHYQGHNYMGQPIPPGMTMKDGTKFDFWIHGAGREQYCKDLIGPRLQKYQPKIFSILLDTFMLYPWLLDMNFSPAKSLFYFPSDGGGRLPLGCEAIIKHMDKGVAMAKFGQKQIKEIHGIDVDYIPHGIDETIFYPMADADKQKLKAEFEVKTITGMKIKGFLKDKFVIGCVSRNQGRKMLDRMIMAFADFCKDKPDAILYFHSDPMDAAAVFNMIELIKELGIENRVCFSSMKFFEGFDYKDMNKVYNLMDVFFLSTSGEGFGIPTIEAAACSIPSVVTDYTTTYELIVENGQCGLPVRLSGVKEKMSDMMAAGKSMKEIDKAMENGTIIGSWNVRRGIMSISDAVVQLNKLYESPEMRKEFGDVGRAKVLKEYTWTVVMEKWNKLFEEMIS